MDLALQGNWFSARADSLESTSPCVYFYSDVGAVDRVRKQWPKPHSGTELVKQSSPLTEGLLKIRTGFGL